MLEQRESERKMKKRIFGLLVAVTFLSACGEDPITSGPGTDHLVLNVPAGEYSRFIVPYVGDSSELAVTIRLSEPRRSTKWSPLINLCAQGAKFSEQACLSFVSATEEKTYITSYLGKDKVQFDKHVLRESFDVGEIMAIIVKAEPGGFSVWRDGKQLHSAPTEFDVVGFSLMCSSAKCDFVTSSQ